MHSHFWISIVRDADSVHFQSTSLERPRWSAAVFNFKTKPHFVCHFIHKENEIFGLLHEKDRQELKTWKEVYNFRRKLEWKAQDLFWRTWWDFNSRVSVCYLRTMEYGIWDMAKKYWTSALYVFLPCMYFTRVLQVVTTCLPWHVVKQVKWTLLGITHRWLSQKRTFRKFSRISLISLTSLNPKILKK